MKATGVTGGVIVHLGCGDGQLTAALRASDRFLLQGLDADATNVEAGQEYVRSLGLYGNVSVQQRSGKRLPYIDNLINLIVAEDLDGVPLDEVMRVLAPLGVAYVKQGERWTKTVKPWPANIDEWPQHLHGADNNAVASDRVVGPPRRLQWVSDPVWSRSHLGLASVTSMVSSKGRLFDIEDQGSSEHPALPGKFALVARDAFNGIKLWSHPFSDWEPVTRHIKSTPAQLQRRLAAIGDIVYCTPGLDAPVTAFDAATGKVLKTYAGTEGSEEFSFDRGVLYCVIGDRMNAYAGKELYPRFKGTAFSPEAYSRESPNLLDPKCVIVAVDADSGRKLWEESGDGTQGYQGSTLAIGGQYAVYCTEKTVVCLDRETGNPVWRTPHELTILDKSNNTAPGIAPTLVISDSAVYVADAKTLSAYSIRDGKKMWEGRSSLNYHKPPDVFLAAGTVWTVNLEGYDPQTGKLMQTLAQDMTSPMGHDRCYRNRSTDRFFINSKTGGIDMLGLDRQVEFPNPWIRGTCGMGVTPCNGLLYAPPPACSCCNWVMMNGLNAVAPEPGLTSSGQAIKIAVKIQLEKGPAYGKVSAQASGASDWPTYRCDGGRSGMTKTAAPASLAPRWKTRLTTKASAPIIVAGRVYLADIDAHTVWALDAADGSRVWTFTAEGRVDSPPTYYKGLILFGSRDGWVYALRASDGALAWRFRDLPDRTICAYGQLESAWPVCGSVLITNDVAYFAAGRNSYLDGGIFVYGLDPQTGRVIHRRQMYGPFDDNGFPAETERQITRGNGLDGFKGDVFLTDGETLYLRQQGFRPDLTPLTPSELTRPHLIPSAGFLETIPHHRSFWTIDTLLRYDIPTGGAAAHGDILVMDGMKFYEVRGYMPGRTVVFDPRPNGYQLVAGEYSKTVPRMTTKQLKAQTKNKGKQTKSPRKSRPEPRWISQIPLTGKAMALAGDTLFVAGTPVEFPADDLAKAYEGRMGGVLWAASAKTGRKVAEVKLDAAPAWDTLAVADGRLYIATEDGAIRCFGEDD